MFLLSNVVDGFFFCHCLHLVPGMIKNVKTTGGFNSINVMWEGEPEDKNGNILYFTVYWREAAQVVFESQNSTHGNEIYTIRVLLPITEYVIHVSATTSKGEGPLSNETFESTRTGSECSTRINIIILQSVKGVLFLRESLGGRHRTLSNFVEHRYRYFYTCYIHVHVCFSSILHHFIKKLALFCQFFLLLGENDQDCCCVLQFSNRTASGWEILIKLQLKI